MIAYDPARFSAALLASDAAAGTSLVPLDGEDALAFAIDAVLEPIRARDPSTPANETLMREVLERSAERGDLFAIVLREGVRAGFVWTSANGPPEHTEIYLNELSLVAPARGTGLGTALLASLERAARAAGVRAIDLDFMADNERVRSLYVRSGYTQVGVEAIGPLGEPRGVTRDISAARESERETLLARAVTSGAFRSFARPHWTQAEVQAAIDRAYAAQTVLVAREGGEVAGAAFWRLAPSITYGDVLCVLDVLDAPAALAPELVDAVCSAVGPGGAARVLVTIPEPSAGVLAELAPVGLRPHRYKLAKRLVHGPPPVIGEALGSSSA